MVFTIYRASLRRNCLHTRRGSAQIIATRTETSTSREGLSASEAGVLRYERWRADEAVA